jgi:hypothetical protein
VSVIDSKSAIEQPPDAATAPGGRFARQWALVRRLGVGENEKLALGLWLISRVGIGLLVWITVWTSADAKSRVPHSMSQVWDRWDVVRYIDIAAHGYSLRAIHGASIAFFPGMPAALYVVHLAVRQWVVSGLLISFVAGAVASVALARIIALEAGTGKDAGEADDADAAWYERSAVRNGVTLWLCSPAAVFLAVGYTEALFLAFALPAWLAARRERWLTAGLLTAGAMAVRINGLFVFAALVVLFLLTRPRGRDWLRGSALLISLVPLAAFFTYLHHLTGSWTAWSHAESQGWDRKLTNPLRTFRNTWHYAFGHFLPAATAWEYQVEILAIAVGVGLLVWLLVRRRWAEAVYVGFSVVTLATSHVYLSVTRELLLWFPLWAALGVWTVRRPWAKTVILTVSTPMMFVVAYLFFTGRWAG